MKKFLIIFILFNVPLLAENINKVLKDLEVIQNVFETKYAPYEWKKSYFGWSLEEEINLAKIKILSLSSLSVKDYQRILHSFFISTCDYHVIDCYYSTEEALIPFTVKSVNGKYIFTEVNKKFIKKMQKLGYYDSETLPEVGNELVLFDSRPVAETIDELKILELGNPTSKTAQVLSEKFLTRRIGALGHAVPSGPNNITFITSDGQTINANINWLYQPEKINNPIIYKAQNSLFENLVKNANYGTLGTTSPKPYKKNQKNPIYSRNPKIMINHLAKELQSDRSKFYKKFFNGKINKVEKKPKKKPKIHSVDRNSLVFGKKVWEESLKSPFKAHIFKLPGTNYHIGYIRIATYSVEDANECTSLIINLLDSIRYLESHSDALIVDQVENPGGSAVYALAISSLLTDKPLEMPKNRVSITQSEIAFAIDNIDLLQDLLELSKKGYLNESEYDCGYPVNEKYFKDEIGYQQFIINQWNLGNTLTEPYPFLGIESLSPHPLANYSKPILMLVDSSDYSGGDIVPAIFQDNKRAVIFGEQTAGAGGIVQQHTYPNTFGLANFCYTTSILERTDGAVIENLGVKPDVPYDLTEDDLIHGYRGYIKAVHSTLKNILSSGKTY